MAAEQKKFLLIGYGNPGRQDDGLGPACAALLQNSNIPGLDIESNYQLTIEDSIDISMHDVVIFVDAAVEGTKSFEFSRTLPAFKQSFTSHILDPQTLLATTQHLFGKAPSAYTMRIRGYCFDEFSEQLSAQAKSNLTEAASFLLNFIRENQNSNAENIEEYIPFNSNS